MKDLFLYTCWLIPIYGLIGSILTLPWSLGIISRTGPRPAAYINLLMTVLGLIHGSIAFNQIWHRETIKLAFEWVKVADLSLSLSIELSPVSLGTLELITLISLLAQIYALGYMEKDWSLARFYGLMGFFEAALGGIALS
ncbi:MAG: NAD(P)H-quinone oxidoreductase subunit F, partial [Microcystis sp.]